MDSISAPMSTTSLQSSRGGEDLFHVAEIGDERLQIAFDASFAPFHYPQNIRVPGAGHRLPQFLPSLRRSLDGKFPGPHVKGTPLHGHDTPRLNGDKVGILAHPNQKVNREEPAPPHEL